MKIAPYIDYITLFIVITLVLRLILPLRLGRRGKAVLALLVGGMVVRGYVHHLIGGRYFDPGLSRELTIVTTALALAAVLLVLWVIGRDVLNLLGWLVRRHGTPPLIDPGSWKIAGAVALAILVVSFKGSLGAFGAPVLHPLEVALPDLPAAASGYRIAFLSDTHISRFTRAEEVADYVARVNAAGPDLVVITGDLHDGTPEGIGAVVAELFKLKPRDGIYACQGNHEGYWNFARWRPFYAAGGVHFLDNAAVTISRDGAPLFTLLGVSDRCGEQALQATVAKAAPELPAILLAHRPETADAVDGQVSLILSGHTHGGMAPILRQIVALANHGYVDGRYELPQGSQLLVSRGTSMWQGLALRFFNDAEIYLITLKGVSPSPSAGRGG